MTEKQKPIDDLKTIAQLLQNLLAIELWRGGLSQAEIGKRLGIATGSVNKMIKGISREVTVLISNRK